MSVWGKLITAFKGHASNAAEAVQDANLMTILEQEVREARQAIAAAKDEKARMSANRKLKEKSVSELLGEIERRTEAARTAKSQGDEPLAIEIVESILKLRDKVEADQALFDQYKATEERMDSSIRQSESKIETLQRKMESAKANEALIKAQKAASTNTTASDGKLAGAVDSLARLEQRQAEQQAILEAADEEARLESGADLEAKIKALENPGRNDVRALLEKL
ncbi:MAG: PspA/IM30 family protein [Roseibium album]|uniref:PspA/IM30 family protein n=1 Tax=Roseibium album TaxID=311410 RepID=A0A0M6ZIT8_9HYPH|nr:PspA/IM30 family protein [Roseibium album]MBG6144566.1 phage shock protein A [Labrenzia sp. EL_142]MBG6154326.1 phage shock protein A [Labrenzia sp. EL_162]MBG6161609.1 phage shock protein A [Labrenzia sp. EL_195]MBG6175195.1 phage shock protein A [Labrenzia sp. EL_132]MBG6193545.1 phage shock protein A [Labrenzia sp. EL_159]MBG6199915.1 phage shock protein A [Labrenzia sp. EL_13]MBG6229807.1 phage shock protein A [Labrenzia sp. EL_208]MCR9059200.1 PspA/IM30 family protein [Paracoccaceae